MRRRVVTAVAALILAAPLLTVVTAVASPGSDLGDAFSQWVVAQEQADAELSARIDELEARVAALEVDPPATTTTIPPTTTTLPDPTTTTTAGELVPSGPITITQNNTVIENRHFTGSSGNCITIQGASNITIRNSQFTNCVKAVYALNSSNITVENILCEADRSDRGRNCVQFDKVNGGRIVNNRSVAVGDTLAEDHISLFQSNGTSTNPILVEGNYVEGGGPSRSGSCIMLGDGGNSSWQIAQFNHCLNTANVGIAIAGGTNIRILDNTIVADSDNAGGEGDVAIYVWNQYGGFCSGHEVSRNKVSWLHQGGFRNSFWNGGNCGSITMVGNDFNFTP
ncbi:MAG TPA: right-handed parallel beta-helix repeat-containing protein [Acidimicrobiia bacterium]